jgi:hypothetical protein
MEVDMQKTVQERVADLLEKLANGEETVLGEFGDNGSLEDPVAEEAELLRELATGLRAEVGAA